MMIINTKEFLRELTWMARFIEKKATIPILSNVLLQGSGGVLRFTATDLETGATSDMTAECRDPLEITVPVQRLITYLKKVGEAKIKLEAGEKQWLTLSHGDSQIRIAGSVESFPQLPNLEMQGTVRGLSAAIPRVLMSISKEESRLTLNGALLTSSLLIATDGHRMAVADIKADLAEAKLLIPSNALKEVKQTLPKDDTVFFGSDENHIQFNLGSRVILTRKLTGNFPDYERVIPKPMNSVTIPSKAAMDLVGRVAVFADERSKGIEWQIDGNILTASASTSEGGSATGTMAVSGSGHEALRIGFNADYLLDGLKEAGDSCEFGYTNGNSAGMFTAPGLRYVVMPMRLDGVSAAPARAPVAEDSFEIEPVDLNGIFEATGEVSMEAKPHFAEGGPVAAHVIVTRLAGETGFTLKIGVPKSYNPEFAQKIRARVRELTIEDLQREPEAEEVQSAEVYVMPEPVETVAYETESSVEVPQPESYTVRMQRVGTLMEARSLIAECERVISSIERDLGLGPTIGLGGSGQMYKPLKSLTAEEEQAMVTAVLNLDAQEGARLQALLIDGRGMLEEYQHAVARLSFQPAAVQSKSGPVRSGTSASSVRSPDEIAARPEDYDGWTTGNKAAWTRKYRKQAS